MRLVATTIRQLEVETLDMPLREPFAIATGTQMVANNLLVRITLADGTVGLGEAAPFPAVSGETQRDAAAALLSCRSALLYEDGRRLRALSQKLSALCPGQPAARCAVEQALLDAWLRHHGLPMWSYFGGSGTELETDMTITLSSREHAIASALAIKERGIRDFKVKVGAGSLGAEVERLRAIHQAVPEARLLLDANGGYTADEALELLSRLAESELPILLLEQPVAAEDREGLLRVAQSSRVPICADESARTVDDVLWLVKNRAAHAINVKLMKNGIWESLAMYYVARAAGLKLMIGGMVEGILSMSVSAHFAAGLGGFSYVDLDTPMFIADHPFVGGFTQHGSHLSVAAVAAGHGVELR
jgi:L-alanine-DL-glutamate epimerase-like enolase superfamily enzyme